MADILQSMMGGGAPMGPSPDASGLGIPQPGVAALPQSEDIVSELISMLRGGQVGADRFMELLALLAGETMGPQGPPMGGPPLGPEMMGGSEMGPMGPAPMGPAGQPSIEDILAMSGGM